MWRWTVARVSELFRDSERRAHTVSVLAAALSFGQGLSEAHFRGFLALLTTTPPDGIVSVLESLRREDRAAVTAAVILLLDTAAALRSGLFSMHVESDNRYHANPRFLVALNTFKNEIERYASAQSESSPPYHP